MARPSLKRIEAQKKPKDSQLLPFAITALAAPKNFTLKNQLTFRRRKLNGKNYITELLKLLFVSSHQIAANAREPAYIYKTYGASKLSAKLADIVIIYLCNYGISSTVEWDSD